MSHGHNAPHSTPTPATVAPTALNPKHFGELVKQGAVGGLIIGAVFALLAGFVSGSLSMFWMIVIGATLWGMAFNLRNPVLEMAKFVGTGVVFCFILISETFLIIMATGYAPADGWEAFTKTSGPYQLISHDSPQMLMGWFIVTGILIWIASTVASTKTIKRSVLLLFVVGVGAFAANQRYHAKLATPHPNHEQEWEYDKVEIAMAEANKMVNQAKEQFKIDLANKNPKAQEKLDAIMITAKEMVAKSRMEARSPEPPNNSSNNANTTTPQPTCKGREVLTGFVLRLEVPTTCKNEFETILVSTDVKKTYRVEFTSGGFPIAAEPSFTAGRGSTFIYNSTNHTLEVEGDLFYKHKPEDIGKQATITLTPIS